MRIWRARFFIAWSHCDAAGIVYYPHAYVWFDEATENLFRCNGLSYRELERQFGIGGMPLIETGATYRSPCSLGDEVEIETRVDDWQSRSFVVRHAIRHAAGQQQGETAFEGFERRVLVAPAPDRPKGIRAIEIPASIIARFVE